MKFVSFRYFNNPFFLFLVSYLKSGISFKNCVKSTPHVLAQVFLTVCKIRTLFFVGTFLNFISDLCGGNRSIGE